MWPLIQFKTRQNHVCQIKLFCEPLRCSFPRLTVPGSAQAFTTLEGPEKLVSAGSTPRASLIPSCPAFHLFLKVKGGRVRVPVSRDSAARTSSGDFPQLCPICPTWGLIPRQVGQCMTSLHALSELSTCYMPVTVLGAGKTAMSTRGRASALMEPTLI